MRPWLLAALLARCIGLRPQTRFGSANYGDDGWQFKKRYAVLGAAATMTSVRPIRRGARFQAGMLRIGGAYAVRYVTRAPLEDVHEATAIKMERLVRDLRGAYVKSASTIFCCQWYSNSLDMMRAILYTTSSSLLYVIAFDHTSRTSAAYF